jgi:hypothetical protein
MIKDVQEYLQEWEKINNPFFPNEMRWDRLKVNVFLKDYKKQLTLTNVVVSEAELVCEDCKGFGWIADENGRRKDHCYKCD